MSIRLFLLGKVLCFTDRWLTVCVTCAGAGKAKPSSQKNDKA